MEGWETEEFEHLPGNTPRKCDQCGKTQETVRCRITLANRPLLCGLCFYNESEDD